MIRLRNLGRVVQKGCAIAAVAGLAACASTGPRDGFAETDRIEPTNRFFHENNVRLDRNVLRPVAQGYDTVTPALVQHLVGNGLNHLDLPVDLMNYLLQGEIDASLRVIGRFTLNTVLGAGGFLDPATEFGLPRERTDFGITLGRYGVDEGTYMVLPLIGPSTARDTVGFVVDRAFRPTTYLGPFTALDGLSPALTAVEFVDTRNRNAEVIDELLYNSEDSYVTLRAAYLQRRRAQVAGREGVIENLPDIFDDEAPKQ